MAKRGRDFGAVLVMFGIAVTAVMVYSRSQKERVTPEKIAQQMMMIDSSSSGDIFSRADSDR